MCDLAHRRSVAVLCMLYKIRCNPMFPLSGVHAVLRSHIGTLMRLLAAEPRRKAGHLFPCQYLYLNILVTQYSTVWDWRVSRTGPVPFYWPSCSLPFWAPTVFTFSSLFYGLILWGWGLRTDRM